MLATGAAQFRPHPPKSSSEPDNAECLADATLPMARGDGHSGSRGRRSVLRAERRRFASRRRSRCAREGAVARRGRGSARAARSKFSRRARASARFWSWLRKRLAVMTSTPAAVMRLPARRNRRARTGSGSDGDRPTSKRSCTALETLLTFWPPGPDARTNASSISEGSMTMVSLTRSIALRRQTSPLRILPPRTGLAKGMPIWEAATWPAQHAKRSPICWR